MSDTIRISLKTIELSDEERRAIAAAIGRTDGRLPSERECREFIVQHGIDGINRAVSPFGDD
jgi:hypothetical protein